MFHVAGGILLALGIIAIFLNPKAFFGLIGKVLLLGVAIYFVNHYGTGIGHP